jgi:cytoskeleton protein RodZ
MATIAEQLHRGREARQLTIEQVGEITKIRNDHLRALEVGNFEVFTAPVYIRGFVRTYSTLLKLDVPSVMAQLDAELAQTSKFAEPPALTTHAGGPVDMAMLLLSKLDWKKSLILLAIIAVLWSLIAGTAAWRKRSKADPLADLKPATYGTTSSVGQTLPVPSTPKR